MARSPWLGRAGITLLVTASAGVLTAAPAQAASTGTATSTSTGVTFKAASGKVNKVTLSISGKTVTIDDRVALKAGKGCKQVKGDKTRVTCTLLSTAYQPIRVHLGDRDDTVVNKSGAGMFAYGGSGKDTLTGGTGGDELYGESGADRIHGDGEHDYLDGGTGNDVLYGDGGWDILWGGGGDDTLWGGADDDQMAGSTGDDRMHGDIGNDDMSGGSGADTLRGDSGDDYLSPGTGADVIRGGSGTDMVSYSGHTKPVTVNLDGRKNDGAKGEGDTVATDVENIYGGEGDDHLTGDGRANRIVGWWGDDVIRGGAGNDDIDGDVGADLLYGQAGDDRLAGTDGEAWGQPDLLDGGADTDYCHLQDNDRQADCEQVVQG
ncbi:calcium-binding protein [Actinoplanes sp. NBRC 101535]|uniref:calcium-binding protein n=1 Tax=Actinoplanes sp. NBRC 101535 TaxID=3032196 RepID=UPI00249FA97F|nr:calcium-binding protein [Actinoplanes sp. NBRC 101535]GLY05186.1 hypothetical protein Acsp01_55650 [Actinoplanes sp. NBRC 101535]